MIEWMVYWARFNSEIPARHPPEQDGWLIFDFLPLVRNTIGVHKMVTETKVKLDMKWWNKTEWQKTRMLTWSIWLPCVVWLPFCFRKFEKKIFSSGLKNLNELVFKTSTTLHVVDNDNDMRHKFLHLFSQKRGDLAILSAHDYVIDDQISKHYY